MQRLLTQVLIMAAALCASAPSHASCTLTRETTLPLTIEHTRLYVPVSMNGTQGLFTVDTGAAVTLLTGAYASAAHVGLDRHAGQVVISGAGGRETLPVNQAHVRQTRIGTITFPDWEYSVVPPEAGGLGRTEREGILGVDFLHYFDLDFDFQANTLTLWRQAGCTDIHPEWKGDYDSIPLKHTASQSVTIPIFIDNAFFDVELDSGSPGLLLTKSAALRAGVTDAALAQDIESQSTGIGGHFPAVRHRFGLLLVGSGQFRNPLITVETESHRTSYADGLMGLRYLQPHKVWLSYATNTLFVQSAGK